MKRLNGGFAVLLATLLLWPAGAGAGWVVTERTEDYVWQGSEGYRKTSSTERTSYLRSGVSRSGESGPGNGEGWTVFDLAHDRILLVDPARRVYYQGSLKAWLDEMGKVAEAMQRLSGGKSAPGPVVQKLGDGGRIAGYATERYSVKEGGVLRRQVWIAPYETLPGELRDMNRRMVGLMHDSGMLEAHEYALQSKGLEMKAEEYLMGRKHPDRVTTVVSIRRERLPDTLFDPPGGYRRVATMEAFGEMAGGGQGDFGAPDGAGMPAFPVMDPADDETSSAREAGEQSPPPAGRDDEQNDTMVDEVGDKARELLRGLGGLFGR